MVHRMCVLPLSEENFVKEQNTIYDMAQTNGYTKQNIDILIHKHQYKQLKMNCSSFVSLQSNNNKLVNRYGCTYDRNVFSSLSKYLANHDINLVPRSNNKLKSLLRSTKDKIKEEQKPGIYMAKCAEKKCTLAYYGQTKRAFKFRRDEHLRDIRDEAIQKSGLVEHIVTHNHKIEAKNFKLIETESQYHRLNILESLHTHINDKNMNRNTGNHPSSLFHILKTNR